MCRHERGGKEDSPRSIVAPALQVADVTEGDAGQLVREYLHSLLKNVEGDYDIVGPTGFNSSTQRASSSG